MSDTISIQITGLEELQAAMAKFPAEVKHGIEEAGKQASVEILETVGLQAYPSETAANQPPTPYYERGMGTQYASGNSGTSETLSEQWNVAVNGYKTVVGNRASYAGWIHGDEQARGMGPNARIPKGWRKLTDVAKEKVQEITRIYDLSVADILRKIGLK